MNINKEYLENRRLQLTVTLDVSRFEQAKKRAAGKVARKVNIPGFRKGKAPYRILVQNGLEPHIMEEAVDQLSQVVYREALEQAEIDPYGPGQFEDFQFEDAPVFVYTVPLQPEAKLCDYRSIRKDFDEPVVEDKEVEDRLEAIRRGEALVEESDEPIAYGNRVNLDIHSEYADEPPELEVDEDEVDDDEEEMVDTRPPKGEVFFTMEDDDIDIDEENEEIAPGFNAKLIGARAGDDLEFELSYPEDDPDDEVAGRTIKYTVTINRVQTVTLPELDDDFAASVTEEDEDGPLTLEVMRQKLRETIYESRLESVKLNYFNEMMDEIVEQSEFSFPDEMLQEQINEMLSDLEERLRGSGMTLDMYYRMSGKTREDLAADYQEPATRSVRSMLALREIIQAEKLTVNDAMIDARIDEMVKNFGEQGETLRSLFSSPDMRMNILNRVLTEAVRDRLVLIGRGEEIPAPDETVAESDVVAVDESTVETETDAPQIDAEAVDVEVLPTEEDDKKDET